jgi:uncharacterized repeat protein (TIGR03803 family)
MAKCSKITSQGRRTPVHIFKSSDGANAYAPVIQGRDGNFYGTTVFGGSNDNGVVFKLSRTGELTVLHKFNGNDGANPYAGLVQAADGSFYGVASNGGSNNAGTILSHHRRRKLQVAAQLRWSSRSQSNCDAVAEYQWRAVWRYSCRRKVRLRYFLQLENQVKASVG